MYFGFHCNGNRTADLGGRRSVMLATLSPTEEADSVAGEYAA